MLPFRHLHRALPGTEEGEGGRGLEVFRSEGRLALIALLADLDSLP